ncbi:hypothetical protein AB0K15_42955 [Amycolatopsis sp. NPDC049253]|uniref:hypothetical protein n=1 Tax=Amycolatopsis sp. NPDC049253 TaxID=3155274 RepID=UPI0034347E6F
MSAGYEIKDPAAFDTFGGKLNELSDNVRGAGDLVGHMVADPGLYGILGGQIIGMAASIYCSEAEQAFAKYGEALEKHKEKLDQAKKAYEAQENNAANSIPRFQP